MERQKVLITGGAGFLGINLVRYLDARGYALASLDVEEFDHPERGTIEVIKGDIRDKALVDRAMEGEAGSSRRANEGGTAGCTFFSGTL